MVEKIVAQKISLKVVERRLGDPDELVADNQKASQLLSWVPKYSSLENIIKTAWAWEQKCREQK